MIKDLMIRRCTTPMFPRSTRSSTTPQKPTAASSLPIAGTNRTCRDPICVAENHRGVDFCRSTMPPSSAGVMGLQKVRDVTLIRHAYVRHRTRTEHWRRC